MRKKITILVPAYNEMENLKEVVDQLNMLVNNALIPTYIGDVDKNTNENGASEYKSVLLTEYDWEYLFVNDGSTDNTLAVLYQLRTNCDRVNIINLSRNFGKENAILAGMDYATGDAVIIMDADLQHPVSSIPEMIYWWKKGYDDVYGKRIQRGKESFFRKHLSLMFYSLLQNTTRIKILQNVGDFRLLDKRVVNAIKKLRETQRYTKGLYCWVGYSKKEFWFEQADRQSGKSSYNFKSLLNLAIEGITCFTTAPLRISTILGFIISLIAILSIIYVIVKTLIFGDPVQGFPTLICVILFLGGLQLVALGIIGEYIGRIFNEAKHRPVYIVESYNEEKK